MLFLFPSFFPPPLLLIRFPVRKSVSSVLSSVFAYSLIGSWHRFVELCGYPIIHNSLFSLCTHNSRMLGSQLHSDFDLFQFRDCQEKDKRIMEAEQCWLLTRRFLVGCPLIHVGTGLDVFWYCVYWNSDYEHRDGLTRPWSKL